MLQILQMAPATILDLGTTRPAIQQPPTLPEIMQLPRIKRLTILPALMVQVEEMRQLLLIPLREIRHQTPQIPMRLQTRQTVARTVTIRIQMTPPMGIRLRTPLVPI